MNNLQKAASLHAPDKNVSEGLDSSMLLDKFIFIFLVFFSCGFSKLKQCWNYNKQKENNLKLWHEIDSLDKTTNALQKQSNAISTDKTDMENSTERYFVAKKKKTKTHTSMISKLLKKHMLLLITVQHAKIQNFQGSVLWAVQVPGCSVSAASPCESKSGTCDEMQNTDNQKRKPNPELKCKMFKEFICEYTGCQCSFYLAFIAAPSRHLENKFFLAVLWGVFVSASGA